METGDQVSYPYCYKDSFKFIMIHGDVWVEFSLRHEFCSFMV